MNESTVITRFIGAVKDEMQETATASMLCPFEPNRAAVASGKYQGLKAALGILEAILSDKLEADSNL